MPDSRAAGMWEGVPRWAWVEPESPYSPGAAQEHIKCQHRGCGARFPRDLTSGRAQLAARAFGKYVEYKEWLAEVRGLEAEIGNAEWEPAQDDEEAGNAHLLKARDLGLPGDEEDGSGGSGGRREDELADGHLSGL